MNVSNMEMFIDLKGLSKMTNDTQMYNILLSYSQYMSDEIPELYRVEKISDTEESEVFAYPFVLFIKQDDNTPGVGYAHILMQENTYVSDGESSDTNSPTSTEYYTLLTKEERDMYNNISAKNKLAEVLDPAEKEFYESIKYPISEYYSEILEKYLMSGNKKATLDSFLDLLVPIVEAESFTLVKYDVKHYIERHSDWYLGLTKNEGMLDFLVDDQAQPPKMPSYLIQDLEAALNNYFRISYRTFAVLSAATRGSAISTSEIFKSCSTYYKKDPTKLFDDRRFFVTDIQPHVPAYSQDFIDTVLMGNIPMFTYYNKDMTVTAVEMDLFYSLKTVIMENCEKLRVELSKLFEDDKDILEVLEFDKTSLTKKILQCMYPKRKNRVPEEAVLKGAYNCIFVDYVVYSRTLMHYLKEKDMKKWSVIDFFNLISPVQMDRDYITKYQEV